MNKNIFLKFYLIPISLFLFFLFFYFSQYKKIPIRYWDEHDWIGHSYFLELSIKRDFNNPLWKTYYSYQQPKLAEYLYGITLYPEYLNYKKNNKNSDYVTFLIDHNFYSIFSDRYFKYKTHKDFINWGKNPMEVFDVSPQFLINKFGIGIKSTIALIFKARRINVLILSLNIVIIYFLILLLVNNPIISFLISSFYGFNYFVLTTGLIAQTEGLFLLLFNCSVLILLKIKFRKTDIKTHFIFAIFIALLTATKLNGIMFLFFYYFYSAIYLFDLLFLNKNKEIFNKFLFFITRSGIVLLIFLTTFILLNPYLYSNPIKNMQYLYKIRLIEVNKQISEYKSWSLPTFQGRISAIYKQNKLYNNLIFLNNKKIPFNIYPFIIFSFIIGIIYILKDFLLERRNFPLFLILSIFLFTQFMMGLYLKLNWDRYFIHLVFFFNLFTALGIIRIIQTCFYLLKALVIPFITPKNAGLGTPDEKRRA